MSSLGKFYTARPRVIRRRKIKPADPIPCIISGLDGTSIGPFPSRTKAKKFIGKIIKDLPPKKTPQEPKKFLIVNL